MQNYLFSDSGVKYNLYMFLLDSTNGQAEFKQRSSYCTTWMHKSYVVPE